MGRRIERTFAWQLPELVDRVNGKEVNVNMRDGRVLNGILTIKGSDCRNILLTDGRGDSKNLLLENIELIHRDLTADF